MNKQSLLRLAVAGAIIVTATVVFGLLVMQDSNEAGSASGGTKFGGRIIVSAGIENTTLNRVDVDISFDLVEGASPQEEYNDVYLCSYTEQGSVVHARNLGTFTPEHEDRNITLSADQPPKYIFVHHPAFYRIEQFNSDVAVFEDEYYVSHAYNAYARLPFDPAKLGHNCTPPT